MSIGEFSSVTHLSIKTLRRYHEAGLLPPDVVDRWTGYRYYGPEQIATAQTIRRLRELDMPVAEIRDFVADPDDGRRRDLLAEHLARVERQLARTQAAVSTLRRLVDPAGGHLEVEHTVRPEQPAVAVCSTVASPDVLGWYAEAMAELDAAMAARSSSPAGPPGGLYANALFNDGGGELIAYVPVEEPFTDGRVVPLVVPRADVAVTTHVGSHADIDVTYGQLGRWVVEHDLAIAGPVHERYLTGPRDTPDELAWLTEIGWPVAAGAENEAPA